jgi:superfamily I DNA/RNA helicase
MHSAKGLEFPIVFIVGTNENTIPFVKACDEGRTEEERRLFYVALTRAKDRLHVSWPQETTKWQKRVEVYPSRFIGEMFDEEELYDILG